MSTGGTRTLHEILQGTDGTIAVVCAWCPELHIMRLPRKPSDLIEIMQEGKRLVIKRNGHQLAISHGMCRSCEADRK